MNVCIKYISYIFNLSLIEFLFYSGATKTTVVLLDSAGNVLCTVVGPGTNHYLLGMTECRKRISDMVNSAKREAGIGEHVPLTALVSIYESLI